jgi:uncharacterized protein (DUF433 family)
MMPDTVATHIEITPGTCGGKPRIAGTRIRVQDIVIWTEKGLSPDEITDQHPHITLADVHAALTWYHDHLAEIDRQIEESERLISTMMADSESQQPQPQSG